MSNLSDARQQMLDAGMPELPHGHPVADSKIHRYGPQKRGYYRLHEWVSKSGEVFVSGSFGLWGRIETTLIELKAGHLDSAERERMEREREVERGRLKAKQRELAVRAANRAAGQWAAATDSGPWPYCGRKGIQPIGVRAFPDGTMLVPVYQPMLGDDGLSNGALIGVQKIAPDGEKRFNRGMAKRGACLVLGEDAGGPAILVEGYATGVSVFLALKSKYQVLVAFDAYSLMPVAVAFRRLVGKDRALIIAADDDWQTEKNTGITQAEAVAKEVGAIVTWPVFKGEKPPAADFNDLHKAEGVDVVADRLQGVVLSVRADAEKAVKPPDPPAEQPSATAWTSLLARTSSGQIKPLSSNVSLILSNDVHWKGVIARNQFTESVMKLVPPPYEKGEAGEWRDLDDIRIRMWLERTYGVSVRREDIVDAVLEAADRRSFHPVRAYFDGLTWDGIERLPSLFADCFGAPRTEYTGLVGVKFMVGAVARILRPGCKLDNVLILEGRQGLQKSTALRVLAGEWFTDAPLKFNDKETYLLLQGQMIIELAELDSFSRSESSAAKLFFSMTESYYRPWYARRPVRVPRQCVFAGTVNNDNYLKDDTGNRRYWPIKCTDIDLAVLRESRDQLWAEAVARFERGERHWVDEEERHLFEDQQSERYVEDAYTGLIREWLDQPEQFAARAREGFEGYQTSDILRKAIKLDVGRWARPEQQRIGHSLRELGFVRKRSSKEGRPWVYVPPTKESATMQP